MNMRNDERRIKRTVSVTVVIPCFNCASTFERALESVLHQTVLPAQVILVDDGSNDATREVIRGFQDIHGADWLKLVSLEQNYGPAHARNEGIKQVVTDYIAFLDADDSWHSKKLELQYLWMRSNSDVALTGHRIVLADDDEPTESVINAMPVTKISGTQALLSNPFSTPTVMMKSNLPYRFESGQYYAEDYLFWLRVCLSDAKVYRLEIPLASMHKAAYGQAGLSQNLVAMEKGELKTYRRIYESRAINCFQYYGLVLFSLAKFFRRIVLLRLVRKTT